MYKTINYNINYKTIMILLKKLQVHKHSISKELYYLGNE